MLLSMNSKMLICIFAFLSITNIHAQNNALYELIRKSSTEIGKNQNLETEIEVYKLRCQFVLLKSKNTQLLEDISLNKNICLLSMEEIFTFSVPIFLEVVNYKIRKRRASIKLTMIEKATNLTPKRTTEYRFTFSYDGDIWNLKNYRTGNP